MSFFESPRFPDAVSYGGTGGPGYKTDVVTVNSGSETRNGNWSQGRCRFEVAHAARMPAEYNPLKAFFRNCKGRLHGFRFKDWSDFAATTGEGVFTLLTPTTFQMWKRYTSGSYTEDRKIQKPITGSLVITGGTVASISYTAGIVTMTSGTPTAWTGEFDVPCRFDVDEMQGEIINRSGGQLVIGWQSIPIIEIRV